MSTLRHAHSQSALRAATGFVVNLNNPTCGKSYGETFETFDGKMTLC